MLWVIFLKNKVRFNSIRFTIRNKWPTIIFTFNYFLFRHLSRSMFSCNNSSWEGSCTTPIDFYDRLKLYRIFFKGSTSINNEYLKVFKIFILSSIFSINIVINNLRCANSIFHFLVLPFSHQQLLAKQS